MKIVTYNVKGLRPRIGQFGSLFKLLNSLDADFICFQETKLRRQELTAELAEGYESFSSRTGTSGRGRTGYSDNFLVWRRFVARSGRSRVTKSLCRRQRRNALPGFLTVEREK